jgi:hypothetical protein
MNDCIYTDEYDTGNDRAFDLMDQFDALIDKKTEVSEDMNKFLNIAFPIIQHSIITMNTKNTSKQNHDIN